MALGTQRMTTGWFYEGLAPIAYLGIPLIKACHHAKK